MRPDVEMADLGTKCVHEEMGVVDKPKSYNCANGARHPCEADRRPSAESMAQVGCIAGSRPARYGGLTGGEHTIGPDMKNTMKEDSQPRSYGPH